MIIVLEKIVLENHIIPSGAIILLNILKVQRNPKYWGCNAAKFIPERFEPEEIEKVHPYAYLPFTSTLILYNFKMHLNVFHILGGPRICLASKYGMMSMKILVAYLLKEYEFSTSLKFEEIELDLPIILKFKQGYKLSIKNR